MKILLALILLGWSIPMQVYATEETTQLEEVSVETRVGDISAEFTDTAFRDFVVKTYGDGTSVTAEDLAAVTRLTIDDLGITNLDGIQYFTSITILLARDNNIPVVNLSDVPSTVHTVSLSNSNVEVLNTAGGENITSLTVHENPLSEIDFSNLTSLKTINASDMPNLTAVDLTGASKLENVTFTYTQITSLDLTGLTLKSVMINGSPISDFKMDEGQKLSVFIFYGAEIETFPYPPVSAGWLDGEEQAPRKEVSVLEDGSKQITLASTSTPDESTIGFDGVYDAAMHTITWGPDVLVRDILTQDITFQWNIDTLMLLSGTYVLEGEVEKEPEPEVDPVAVHTVNFYDCDGNLVGQDWPSDGENATGPSGYSYGSTELTNITYSKDVKPTSCLSGEFAIPNTGVE